MEKEEEEQLIQSQQAQPYGFSSLPRLYKVLIISLAVLSVAAIALFIAMAVSLSLSKEDSPLTQKCDNDVQDIQSDFRAIFRTNRARLSSDFSYGAIFMSGDSTLIRNDDVEYLFRQNSDFFWMSGVDLPDCHVVIEVGGETTLFIPNRGPEYALWSGHIISPSEAKEKFDMDNVLYSDNITVFLNELRLRTDTIYLWSNTTEFPVDNLNFTMDYTSLKPAVYGKRMIKSDEEIKVLDFVSKVGSKAHELLMTLITPGMYEYQLESIFLYRNYFCGCRQQAYTPIVASGRNGAVLHYISNLDEMADGDLLLIDSGGEYYGYGTDITRTYPVNGAFTEDQKKIYNIVLDAQTSSIAKLAPGVEWSEITQTAVNTTLQGLLNVGLVTSEMEDLLLWKIDKIFFPHGLGHFVGQDVHDTNSISGALEEGMVLTIEPGIYFNDVMLDIAFANDSQAQYLVKERIDQFRGTGGVRIEDVVLITQNGHRELSDAVKEIDDIEDMMRS